MTGSEVSPALIPWCALDGFLQQTLGTDVDSASSAKMTFWLSELHFGANQGIISKNIPGEFTTPPQP